jgi:hypothetical protein
VLVDGVECRREVEMDEQRTRFAVGGTADRLTACG